MSFEFLRWSKWSPHAGNAITIATGIPTISSIIAWVWAHVTGNDLSTFVVVLAVFAMTLWCCVGVIWLRDRGAVMSSRKGRSASECAWGLRAESVVLGHDISPTAAAQWQFSILLLNQLKWPIRVEVEVQHLVVEHRTPKTTLNNAPPHILMPGQGININYPGYKTEELPAQERWQGDIDFSLKYGHPDGPFTRRMVRKFSFEALVKPSPVSLPDGSQMQLMPIPGRMSVNFWSREEDTDEPI